MHDSSIPISKLITYGLWLAVVAALCLSWAEWLFGSTDGLPLMIAFTGCVITGAACVASFRCYCVRLSRIIRATAGAPEREGNELRAIP